MAERVNVSVQIAHVESDLVWTPEYCEVLNDVERPMWIERIGFVSRADSDVPEITNEIMFQNRCSLEQLGSMRAGMARDLPQEIQRRRAASLSQALAVVPCCPVHPTCPGDGWTDNKGAAQRVLLAPGMLETAYGCRYVPINTCTSMLTWAVTMQMQPGAAHERVLLYQAEGSVHPDGLRAAAMQHGNPIHTFMFARDGSLLCANKHAWDRYRGGGPITLQRLFDEGCYPRGAADAQAACAEALQAIFEQGVECHRHMQPRRSKKADKMRFTMCEMWPLEDPVTGQLALQMCLHSITKQKEVEIELQSAQEQLQHQMLQLEQQKQQLEQDKAQIQEEKAQLAERLEAVVNSTLLPTARIDTDTPVDKTLNLLSSLIRGVRVPSTALVDVFNMLSKAGTDLRAPVALEKQLLEDSDIDADVGAAMFQLLKGSKLLTHNSMGAEEANLVAAQRQRRHSSITNPGEGLTMLDLVEPVPASLIPEVERLLAAAETQWQFDPFQLAEAAPECCLSMLTFHLINKAGLVEEFGLQQQKLGRYLRRVEMGYTSCPYHNRVHVLSVVQMMHMLLHQGGLLRVGVVDKVSLLASYIAAAVHDFEHQGFNNDFLIKTKDPLAITYNDQSPLENHHLAASSRLLLRSQFAFVEVSLDGNLKGVSLEGGLNPKPQALTLEGTRPPLQDMPAKDQQRLRATIIEQVLGTDMKRHFGIISRFQNSFQRAKSTEHSPAERNWERVSLEDRTLAQQVALKCADIGHLTAAPATHKRWALQLEEEFFLQGDHERSLGLPVSPLMDRTQKGGITRSQLGFFSIVGIPLFKAMVDVFEGAMPMLEGVMTNYKAWELATDSATHRE